MDEPRGPLERDNGNPGTPVSYAQWQTNVPSDTHSSAGNPGGSYSSAMFVAPATADLHLVPGGNLLVNDRGTPVAGVTTDYDGQTRSVTTPYLGADELITPYHLWALANGLPTAPDANGGQNLIRYAFNSSPTAPQLPLWQLSGVNFVVSFTQPLGVSGITYGAEWNTTLTGTWTPMTDTGVGNQHTFNLPIGSNTQVFVRLKVTVAP